MEETLVRGGRDGTLEVFLTAVLRSGSVGECWGSCFAAVEAVVAIAAAGSLPGIVGGLGLTVAGDLETVGDVAVCSFFEAPSAVLGLVCVSTLGTETCGLSGLSFFSFASSRAF